VLSRRNVSAASTPATKGDIEKRGNPRRLRHYGGFEKNLKEAKKLIDAEISPLESFDQVERSSLLEGLFTGREKIRS